MRVLSPVWRFVTTRSSYGLKLLLALVIIDLPGVLLSSLSWWNILIKAFPRILEEGGQRIFHIMDIANWVGYAILLIFWLVNWQRISRYFAMIYTAFTSLYLIVNVIGLIFSLFSPEQNGPTLLADGAIVWASNVLIFTMWYWLLDGGGSEARTLSPDGRRDFAFVQCAYSHYGRDSWRPRLADYLFTAFLTSTNFAPADVVVLSRRIKSLMMIQVGLSIVIMAVLASRAINILR